MTLYLFASSGEASDGGHFTAKHEARQELESYVASVENTINSPEIEKKVERQAKAAVESELAKALERLEIVDSTADQLKKNHLLLRRAMQKAMSGGR
ncbi:hypothetical protein BCR35DRAFT_333235 [Leucosporidium creatinivorum]|uniref:Uncharacterized protein n=1 Tax=Leucosporidium creatinivorum TaxID=106004 RepID=A0A1Y2EUT6_9BASI|nr:hypothetical protein BCR35DRAFT_333235 [Leucosporidium creatinivorum]